VRHSTSPHSGWRRFQRHLPSAWVAQDRQGSKARMATSMWLSRPSVTRGRRGIASPLRAHAVVHGLVVVRGGDDQVGANGDQVVVVDAVVVDQRAARCLDDADAAFLAFAVLAIRSLPTADVVVVQQVLDHFGGVQHFDHARPVVGQRGAGGAAAVEGEEFLALLSASGVGMLSHSVHARQRADAVPAVVGAERLEEGELHVGPGLDVLFDDVPVAAVVEMVEQGLAVDVARAQAAVVEVHRAVGPHQAHAGGAEAAEGVVLGEVLLEQLPRIRAPRRGSRPPSGRRP
jgi:hypothetical protein